VSFCIDRDHMRNGYAHTMCTGRGALRLQIVGDMTIYTAADLAAAALRRAHDRRRAGKLTVTGERTRYCWVQQLL